VKFALPVRGISPGQAIVFYQEDECLGGAIIKDNGTFFKDHQRLIKYQRLIKHQTGFSYGQKQNKDNILQT